MTTKLIFYFRLFIALCFIALAVVIYLYRNVTQLSEMQTYAFAGLLCIYGFFRVYRAFKAAENVFEN
jgi:uncharacterized membrane protein HdeD (DUF308 family)